MGSKTLVRNRVAEDILGALAIRAGVREVGYSNVVRGCLDVGVCHGEDGLAIAKETQVHPVAARRLSHKNWILSHTPTANGTLQTHTSSGETKRNSVGVVTRAR